MFKLSRKLIACVLCLIAPQVHACMGAQMEDTIFFNADARHRMYDNQPPSRSKAIGMVSPLPDADVIAEIFLTDLNDHDESSTAMATANVIRVIKTTDARVRQGAKITVKFDVSSCGPQHRNGHTGSIFAKVGTDSEGRLVLCLYSRRFIDGLINSPRRSCPKV